MAVGAAIAWAMWGMLGARLVDVDNDINADVDADFASKHDDHQFADTHGANDCRMTCTPCIKAKNAKLGFEKSVGEY